jgi:cytochrome c peroxidase
MAAAPVCLALVATGLRAQTAAPPTNALAPLSTVPVPEPPNLSEFVRDREAAIRLGKALFWDMQVGSDGATACASCHFNAGADSRAINQISPGLLRVAADGSPDPDNTFTLGKPNQQLIASDFPFRKLRNINDPNSKPLADSNDVASSQGVFNTRFVEVVPGSAVDSGVPVADPVFNVGGANVRRVAPRNTPSVINAVFNFRNFWDGRAQNDFNGVNPFGSRDPNARVLMAGTGGSLSAVQVRLTNASLASQAAGPPLSHFEMSHEGRTFSDIGRKFSAVQGKKMMALRPLGQQLVAPDDSALGGVSRYPNPGLIHAYRQMIQTAFHPKWWNSPWVTKIGSDGSLTVPAPSHGAQSNDEYTMDEYNFALFFGIAVQMYQATLVSDDTPLDRHLAGNTGALTLAQKRGLSLFTGKARCANCHGGPELTNASVRNVMNQRLERMLMGDGKQAVYDNGFLQHRRATSRPPPCARGSRASGVGTLFIEPGSP